MSNAIFEVVVGNVGTVYAGNNYMVASCKFQAYVRQSKQNDGRPAGESVTLFHNGAIRHEYVGTLAHKERN